MAENSLGNRIKNAWNAFINNDSWRRYDYGAGYSRRPDRPIFTRGAERSIVSAVENRIALDIASVKIEHVLTDDDFRYKETIQDELNYCLTQEANIDQTGRAFIYDCALSMFDEGVVAMVPVDTEYDPNETGSFKIHTLRTGKILEWFPNHVRVRVYNDRSGRHEDLILDKKFVGIVENPFYAVMNEENSIMKRLTRKLSLLDFVDEQNSSGKLDMIIQLPYVIKTPSREAQAEKRRKDIETQLTSSKYGIAYTDGTEKITQLNRPLENNLLQQVEYLTNTFYSQLGMTTSIMDGTADEITMKNYMTRIIEPSVSAIVDEMRRKFLTKTARTQHQTIMFFSDPFKLVPVSQIADIADKFTRNEILSSNEVRQIVGFKPSNDPNADELRNKNLNQSNDELRENKEEVEENVTE